MATTSQPLEWIEPAPIETPEWALQIAGGQQLIAETLIRRGLTTPEQALAFMNSSAYSPADPFDLPDMEKAVLGIEGALAQQERIGVWGDFDVDGQTATALLVSALRCLNADVVYHIPVRARESHGIQLASLQTFMQQNIKLLLTCDTGITAHESVDYAQSTGVEVVITDHHSLPEDLPHALAVVNPQRVDTQSPLSPLCGVGTAYKLVEALFTRAGLAGELENFTDLAALGSVADLAVMRGETRSLVQRGLEQLRNAPRPALQAMLTLAGVQGAYLSESHIGYLLGPQLNAIGRLDDANPIVEFLITTDQALINVTAARLEGLNARRKLLTDQVFQAAQAQITQNPDLLQQAALILTHPNWPAGVIGIVASRLVELYNLPTILFTAPEGQVARGSARSIDGVNITAAIADCRDLVVNFGGHPMAAGLGIQSENLPAFQRRLNRSILSQTGGKTPARQLIVDAFLNLKEIDLELVENLDRLSPFGPGNPPLTLASRNLKIISEVPVGRNGEHVQLTVEAPDGNSRRVIWWQGAGLPRPAGRFDLAYTLSASNYRGQPQVQMAWQHARSVEHEKPAELQKTKLVYQINDLRSVEDAEEALRRLPDNPDRVIWAEGDAAKVGGLARHQLQPAQELTILTSPPGSRELASVLDRVQPEIITLFAIPPTNDEPEFFIRRLAGLVAFTLNRRDGQSDLAAFSAATAQRETTVRAGLDWLAAHGDIQYEVDQEGVLAISKGGITTPVAQETAFRRLSILLDETAAYRAYFHRADPFRLLAHSVNEK
ncbi:MAG TPA: single-stranded-DNA-specific exonuclease RecJ [Longilinea sp.]|nr:single-stranded-DNA-specific exonuclease RecJ [Longilinea sp.]